MSNRFDMRDDALSVCPKIKDDVSPLQKSLYNSLKEVSSQIIDHPEIFNVRRIHIDQEKVICDERCGAEFIFPYRCDFVIEMFLFDDIKGRLIVEADSMEFHGTVHDRIRDGERDRHFFRVHGLNTDRYIGKQILERNSFCARSALMNLHSQLIRKRKFAARVKAEGIAPWTLLENQNLSLISTINLAMGANNGNGNGS